MGQQKLVSAIGGITQPLPACEDSAARSKKQAGNTILNTLSMADAMMPLGIAQ
jgi:hypothetical protein